MLKNRDTEYRSDHTPLDPYIKPGAVFPHPAAVEYPALRGLTPRRRYWRGRDGRVRRMTHDYQGGYVNEPRVLTARQIYGRD